jgi:hypothetical protein
MSIPTTSVDFQEKFFQFSIIPIQKHYQTFHPNQLNESHLKAS